MQATKEQVTEETFLQSIYQNVKMGSSAIIALLPKIKDDGLRSAATEALDGYETYAARAARALEERGAPAKEKNPVARLGAKVGMAMETVVDDSTGHLAELLIEGSNMGIVEMIKLGNHFDPPGEESDALRLSREIVRFQQHNLEQFKRYL